MILLCFFSHLWKSVFFSAGNKWLEQGRFESPYDKISSNPWCSRTTHLNQTLFPICSRSVKYFWNVKELYHFLCNNIVSHDSIWISRLKHYVKFYDVLYRFGQTKICMLFWFQTKISVCKWPIFTQKNVSQFKCGIKWLNLIILLLNQSWV